MAKDTGTHNGREWSISGPGKPSECYPKSDTYTWGEFAGMVIEIGGYADLSAVDPYTGRRFWLSNAYRCDQHTQTLTAAKPGDEAIAVLRASHGCEQCRCSFYTALRRLVDAMETARFGQTEQGTGIADPIQA